MSARNPDPTDPKTNPNTRGRRDAATAARDDDAPEPRWYTDWVARSILRDPRHARLLAESLLPDPVPAATDRPPPPPAPLGSEYYIG